MCLPPRSCTVEECKKLSFLFYLDSIKLFYSTSYCLRSDLKSNENLINQSSNVSYQVILGSRFLPVNSNALGNTGQQTEGQQFHNDTCENTFKNHLLWHISTFE